VFVSAVFVSRGAQATIDMNGKQWTIVLVRVLQGTMRRIVCWPAYKCRSNRDCIFYQAKRYICDRVRGDLHG